MSTLENQKNAVLSKFIEKLHNENNDLKKQIDLILTPSKDAINAAKARLIDANNKYHRLPEGSPEAVFAKKILDKAQAAVDELNQPAQKLIDNVTENTLAITNATTQMTADSKDRFEHKILINQDGEIKPKRDGILGLLDYIMDDLFCTAFKFYRRKASGDPIGTTLNKEMEQSLAWMSPGDKYEYEEGFNFVELCQFLNADPEAIREAINRMSKMTASELEKAFRRYKKTGIQKRHSYTMEETDEQELV